MYLHPQSGYRCWTPAATVSGLESRSSSPTRCIAMTQSLRWLAALAISVLMPLLPASAAAADGDRLRRIEASKVLRVCIWPDYYGISFRDRKSVV